MLEEKFTAIPGQVDAIIHQAHERIIVERRVDNKDKTPSLYEANMHVIVRCKASPAAGASTAPRTPNASGISSTVCGGSQNLASGYAATVGGGHSCRALGSYSFAAGRNARADRTGAFVWADSDSDNVYSAKANQFKARARGGFDFVTAYVFGVEWGAELPAGATAWEPASAKETKENYADVDAVDVLEKLASMPVQRWNYRHQDADIQHIGPYAQDFHEAFGLNGEYHGTISTQDADGIALAAIQGVNQKLEREVAHLRTANSELESRLAAIESRLAELTP